MMKKVCLAVSLSLLLISVSAQKRESANPLKDKLVYEGYSIRLIPVMGTGYGYEIFSNNQLVVHQSYNPFTMSPSGLSRKEDAYKLAKWQIRQIKEKQQQTTGKLQTTQEKNHEKLSISQATISQRPQRNQPLPAQVAKELNINTQL